MLGVAQITSMLYASSHVNRDLVITNSCCSFSQEMSLTVSLPKLGERVKHELDGVRDRDTSKGRVASASTTPRFGVWDPCENPGLQPNDWNKTLHAVRVMLGPSAPGATIVDMDIETDTELDYQIASVVDPSRWWSKPSRLSPA